MRTVELFAGAGGASLGILAAGFTEVRAVEWNHEACETRRAAGLRCDEGDVRDPVHYEGVSADVVWSSFPCQAWSTAGKRLGKDDPRNGWPWTVDVLDQVRPRWFLGENVAGLTHHRGGCERGRCTDDCARLYLEQTILRQLRDRFAYVDYRILDCARYGVPQNRERLILVAGPRPIEWPRETHAPPSELRTVGLFGETRKPWRTVREALNLGGAIVRESGVGAEREPRSVDEPAYTMRVQHNGGGCGVSVVEDPKHPHVRPESPAPTIRSGGSGHSSPPMWLREDRGAGMSDRHGARPDKSIDEPSPVIRAGSGGSGSRVSLVVGVDYQCPKPANGPRTAKEWIGKVLSFAPCDDACVICDHCGEHRDNHGRLPSVMREDPSRGWEAHDINEPSPAVRAGRPGGGLGTRAASRPELLDRPSPTVTAVGECKGSGDGGNPQKMQRASDALFLGAGIRRLTPAECAILQDFPPDHPWRGTKTSIYAQIGNSVPRSLAYVLMWAIRDADAALQEDQDQREVRQPSSLRGRVPPWQESR